MPVSPLRVDALSARYAGELALDSVSFSLQPGHLLGIVGPNGAGKSTLLKAALGLMPARGSARFFGKPLQRVRKRVAYMPQSLQLDLTFPVTVFDVVLMGTYPRLGWVRRPGSAQRGRAAEALESVGLAGVRARPIGELSGGQRQRVLLARALAQDPDLLIMDEPFQGVDAASERTIIGVLRDLRGRGTSIAMVHHDLATVPDYCDEVLLLNRHVIAAGPVGEVFVPEHLETAFGLPHLGSRARDGARAADGEERA